LNRQIQVLTSGQKGGKLDEWAHCSSWPVSWSASLSTAPERLALGGSHSGRLRRQRVTSGILLGATLAVQCCMLLERSSSYSLFSSSSSRPWSPTSGACGLLAWKISIRRSDLPLPAGSQARAFAPLASPMLDPLALASSSRSQVNTRTASAVARLAWDRPSGGVRWRPPLAVVIVTHLVTRPLASRCSQRLFRRSSRASLRPVTLQLSDQHASPWMTALLLPYSLDRAGSGEDAHTSTHTDYRKRHSTLR